MAFNPKYFGLKIDYLYEIIATTYSITDDGLAIKPNASCMGIRVMEGNHILISPFYSTSTYKNLKEQNKIVINFIDDIYLYALAALKEPMSPIGLIDFPLEYYDFKHLKSLAMDIPYIKKAWGILIGEISKEFQKTKIDELGELFLPVFKLDVIFTEKFQESHRLFNRADNLALETIILATRLKVAKENKNPTRFIKIYERILDYIENIERFGKNKEALKAIELVNKYIHHFL